MLDVHGVCGPEREIAVRAIATTCDVGSWPIATCGPETAVDRFRRIADRRRFDEFIQMEPPTFPYSGYPSRELPRGGIERGFREVAGERRAPQVRPAG
jgi:hypothetical protein